MNKKMIMITGLILAVTTGILAGCISFDQISIDVGGHDQRFKVTGEETASLNISDAANLHVKNETGSIAVNKTDGTKVELRLAKKVSSSTQAEAREILDAAAISAEVRGDTLEISAVNKDTKGDFWKWKADKHQKANVQLAFYVDVPRDFKVSTLDNITGDVDVNGLKGAVRIGNTTGNITLQNMTLEGRNLVSLITGNIIMNAGIDNTDALEATNTTGNVILSVPSDSGFSIKAEVITGTIGGSFVGMPNGVTVTGGMNFSKEFNGGGREVSLRTVTGNVIINSK